MVFSFLVVLFLQTALAADNELGSTNCPIFPADNAWNTKVDCLPVHPRSNAYVNTIGATNKLKADFGAGTWNGGPIGIPFTTVTSQDSLYTASFLYDDESDPGPYRIPLDAPIEGGPNGNGDRHAIAIDTETCVLYEMFYAFPQANSWKADSGVVMDLTSNDLRPKSWTSADAAGLAIFPGLVRYEEIQAGAIHHALRFTTYPTQRAYVWPARHYASSNTNVMYPPMGQRFRLKSDFDISGFSATNQIILTAMKEYGLILADNGSPWFVSGVPDARWNNDDLQKLRTISGSAFEAVDTSFQKAGTEDSGKAVPWCGSSDGSSTDNPVALVKTQWDFFTKYKSERKAAVLKAQDPQNAPLSWWFIRNDGNAFQREQIDSQSARITFKGGKPIGVYKARVAVSNRKGYTSFTITVNVKWTPVLACVNKVKQSCACSLSRNALQTCAFNKVRWHCSYTGQAYENNVVNRVLNSC